MNSKYILVTFQLHDISKHGTAISVQYILEIKKSDRRFAYLMPMTQVISCCIDFFFVEFRKIWYRYSSKKTASMSSW